MDTQDAAITCHANEPMAHLVESWTWKQPDANRPFRSCPYCGSIHPDDLREALAQGARLEGSDWKYGWPHKLYVHDIGPGKAWGKWYTKHLLDLSDDAYDQLAPVLSQHSGILFSRNESGRFYQAPYHGYQKGMAR